MSELESKYASEAILSGWITTGPKCKQFEKMIEDYCGVKKAAVLASATAAMEMTLRLLGVGAGDEVITSAYTYTASASVIDHVGAKIVLVDTLPDSLQMDLSLLENAMTERTKAIIPVDVAGVPCDYKNINRIVREKSGLFKPANDIQRALGRVAVVADAAHSFGALYKGEPAARFSDFCCFSFHAVKNLTTAEGGAVCFGDIGDIPASEIYRRFMLWSLHGQNKDAFAKTKLGAWEYDIIYPAYKCNMTDIMAAIGIAQLERYDGMLARRKQMVARYDRLFEGTRVLPTAHEGADFCSSHHLYITRIDGASLERRNEIITELAKKEVCANVHYKPLPLHTCLSDEQIDFTANTLKEILGD